MHPTLEKWKDYFMPCDPCINPHRAEFGHPGPFWSLTIVEENGVERFLKSCQDGWGLISCPNSPRNAEVKAMTEEEKFKWSTPLFPILDVARHFATVFGWTYVDRWK